MMFRVKFVDVMVMLWVAGAAAITSGCIVESDETMDSAATGAAEEVPLGASQVQGPSVPMQDRTSSTEAVTSTVTLDANPGACCTAAPCGVTPICVVQD